MKFNIKKKLIAASLVGAMIMSVGIGASHAYASADRESIAQVALLQSLARGYFGGTVTAGQLRTLGDTGIGTFEGLNGEMIVLNGTIYQALGSGKVVVVPDKEIIPFANVTFFDKDISVKLLDIADKAALERALNQAVQQHGVNSFYMIKLHAEFPSILFRSEYGSKEPYPTLVEALKDKQTEFTEKNIKGTLVGLYCPNYMGELNSVGWHFHFISSDKKFGGHVLQMNIKSGKVQFDKTDNFSMYLPEKNNFQNLNLANDMREDIRRAENDTQS